MNDYCEYTKGIIEKFNLTESITVRDYLDFPDESIGKLPEKSGVYFVILPYVENDDIFINPGTGGYYQGKDPNVSISELTDNWVKNADILYIGKAGGIRKDGSPIKTTLKVRIRTLLKYGNKDNKAAHKGGRYLWQHKNSKNFRIYWYTCKKDENAVELKKELLKDFYNEYGKLPFAKI